jgi:hypothetical protein
MTENTKHVGIVAVSAEGAALREATRITTPSRERR